MIYKFNILNVNIQKICFEYNFISHFQNNSFVCVGCNSSVCKESDIFPMFKEGQQSDYRNAIGTTFDLVTVVTVQGLRLADESLDEYLSWYPG